MQSISIKIDPGYAFFDLHHVFRIEHESWVIDLGRFGLGGGGEGKESDESKQNPAHDFLLLKSEGQACARIAAKFGQTS